MRWKINKYNLIVPAEFHKVNIGVRSISIYNKQLISIVFNIRTTDFRGFLYFYSSGILFKIFKPLKAHFLI